MLKKAQRLFVLAWFCFGYLLRPLLEDWPKGVATIVVLLWLTGLLPAFLFSIGYHESPNYLRDTTAKEDAISAISIWGSLLKYLFWWFPLAAIAGFVFLMFGYSD